MRVVLVTLAVIFGATALQAEEAVATFAGGCFWCMEPPFERVPGVISVTSGYAGGTRRSPSYEEVSSGRTGHAESVRVVFDPARVTFEQLLDVFWHNIDPTVAGRQFCDVGAQYRSVIFAHGAAQRAAAVASRAAVQEKLGVPVKTEVLAAGPFYPAEEYHQDYAKKNPIRYRYYRNGCGRDARLQEIWGTAAGSH